MTITKLFAAAAIAASLTLAPMQAKAGTYSSGDGNKALVVALVALTIIMLNAGGTVTSGKNEAKGSSKGKVLQKF